MSVAPLSINAEREKVVDFTTRFITRYVSVLMKRPRSDTSYFEFLAPFHPIVWFCTLGSVVFVSFVLTILERIGAIGTQQQSSITFKQSCWHVFGSLLRGSTNIVPTTIAGKILTAFWWIFVLIIITSYTANLTAFLTVTKIKTPIKSIKDLTTQSKVHFGTVRNSGIASFFETTHVELFKTLWKQMSEMDQYSFVNSSQEGFKRVSEEPYAFFWDSTVNKYKTGENCDLMEIGPLFGPKGFGIAVPTGATYKEELSLAILKLGDTGRLERLQYRWWGKRQCPDQSVPTDETLHFDKLAGVFIILIVGVAAAITVCLGEYFVGLISNKIKKKEALFQGSPVQNPGASRKTDIQEDLPEKS